MSWQAFASALFSPPFAVGELGCVIAPLRSLHPAQDLFQRQVTVQVMLSKPASRRRLRLLIAGRKQRRGGFATQSGLMGGGEILQDTALLLLQRRHHCHHTFDKARAVRTLGAKAALAPLHTR